MTKTIDALVEALERADQFITNGIALGFIRMPDADTPDTAHETPKVIRAALAQARAEQAEPQPNPFAVYQIIQEKNAALDQCRRLEKIIADLEEKLLATPPAAPVAKTCDMGQMCLGCEPKRPDGGCPDAAPVAKLEPLSEREIVCATMEFDSTVSVPIARAVEAAHNAKLGGA